MEPQSDPKLAAFVDRLETIFGDREDTMEAIEARVRRELPDLDVIVWEGDAATFQFTYVSEAARRVLGYDPKRWTTEPGFWAEVVVHPDDRDYAVSFCALATGQGRDHDFEYRAVASDGSVRRLHDIVRLRFGPRGFATQLRGLMIDVTDLPETDAAHTIIYAAENKAQALMPGVGTRARPVHSSRARA